MRPGWLFACLAAVAICSLTRLHPPAVHAQQAYLAGADQIFQARCSTCHAEHGEGSEVGASLNVPDLRSQSVQQLNDDQLRRIIQEGKGDMPRFKRDFTEEEIAQLIKLVRSFARQKASQGQ